MIRGLIFDFDGLILDTETPHFRSWQELYRQYGCEISLEMWTAYLGTGWVAHNLYEQLETLVGQPLGLDTLRAIRRPRHDELQRQEAVRPGILAYLTTAQRLGVRRAVASSSPEQWVGGYLDQYGITAHFDAIRCADHVQQVKPAPDLYLSALEALCLQPEEAIAFEDSPIGIQAAKAAGIYCVAVPNPVTRLLALDAADLRVESLAELPLERLLAMVQGEG